MATLQPIGGISVPRAAMALQGVGAGPMSEPMPSPPAPVDFEPQYEAVSAAPSNGQQVRKLQPSLPLRGSRQSCPYGQCSSCPETKPSFVRGYEAQWCTAARTMYHR